MAAAAVPRWTLFGGAALDQPYWHAHSSLVTGDLGHSIHCAASAEPCGVYQTAVGDGFSSHEDAGSAIVLQSGRTYRLRLVLQSTDKAVVVNAALSDSLEGEAWSGRFELSGTSGWRTMTSTVRVPRTTLNATLRIGTRGGGAGAWSLGAASLTPSNAWRGVLRADVVERLRQTGFRGLLRYPGGCFAPFHRWRVGLLPPDLRPPMATPPGYCAAVSGGVDAFTDGVVTDGLGIDDYLGLCKDIGMTPAIGVRLQYGGEEELREAAEWVEYVNGDAQRTEGGRLRAIRGHAAPHNVSYWYLGNEISQQQRYRGYPATHEHDGPPSADEYAKMLSALVPRVRAASPSWALRLIVVGTTNEAWNRPWMRAVGAYTFAASLHNGYMNEPARPFVAADVSACAQRPRGSWRDGVVALGQQFDKLAREVGLNTSIRISADEWLGPPWTVGFAPWKRNFSVVHAMYAAGAWRVAALWRR